MNDRLERNKKSVIAFSYFERMARDYPGNTMF